MAIIPTPLIVNDLSVQYSQGTVAVSHLFLNVNPGEIFALVGPNGSGKSSLLNTIAGLLTPSTGSIQCGSQKVTGNPTSSSHYITLMSDPLGLYNDLTALQYLQFFAGAHGFDALESRRRIKHAVVSLGLDPYLHQSIETLSAGWQRRLALGRMMMVDSPILLFDEPAAGLDVMARGDLLLMIRHLAREGRTIIVTSHILSELEQIGDRFGIIKKGQWVAFSKNQFFFTLDMLKNRAAQSTWIVRCSDSSEAIRIFIHQEIEIIDPTTFRIQFSNDQQAALGLKKMTAADMIVFEFKKETATLNQVAIELLGETRS